MMLPCEIAVKSVLPAIRSEIVKILYFEYHMKQTEIAKLLGISQPAVSHYIRGIRGSVVKLDGCEDVKAEIRKFVTQLVNGNLSYADKTRSFCRICMMIRAKGLLCDIHRKYDPEAASAESCDNCMTLLKER